MATHRETVLANSNAGSQTSTLIGVRSATIGVERAAYWPKSS